MPAPTRRMLLLCLLTLLSGRALADAMPAVEAGRAQLLVIRPDPDPNELTLQVVLNGKPVGQLEPARYLAASVEPGRHTLRIDGGEKPVEESFTVAAGEGAYFHVIVEAGWWNYRTRMRVLDQEIAERYLIKTPAASAEPVKVVGIGAPLAAVAVAAPQEATPEPEPLSAAPVPAGGDAAPSISIVTLGVTDLRRSVAFYRDGLGFPLSDHSDKNIAFFDLRGTWLALYPRQALAADAGLQAKDAGAFPGFTLSRNLDSQAAVDAFMERASRAGAEMVKPAAETFWGGYSGYFRDPDGFLWEIAWNPALLAP